MTHKVHMQDGTTQVLDSDALEALDPETYHAQEPADRPRYIVMERLSDRKAVFAVHDRDGELPDEDFGTDGDGADAKALALNGGQE